MNPNSIFASVGPRQKAGIKPGPQLIIELIFIMCLLVAMDLIMKLVDGFLFGAGFCGAVLVFKLCGAPVF